MEKRVLTLREASRVLAVSERTLWSWVKAGKVPCLRIRRTIRIPVAALEQWLLQEASGRGEPQDSVSGGFDR